MRSASPRSTRSSTSSTGSASPRTSSSGHEMSQRRLHPSAGGRTRRPRKLLARLGHAEIRADPRGRPALGRRQADRQHGPRAVPRRPADRHGRAVRRARARRGRQPVPRRSATSPPQGVAVVYISHRLEEIRTIGDRVTVLKDGRTVATGLPAGHDPDRRGRRADDRPHDRVRLPAAPARPAPDARAAAARSRT